MGGRYRDSEFRGGGVNVAVERPSGRHEANPGGADGGTRLRFDRYHAKVAGSSEALDIGNQVWIGAGGFQRFAAFVHMRGVIEHLPQKRTIICDGGTKSISHGQISEDSKGSQGKR